jgi:hypothetical protein
MADDQAFLPAEPFYTSKVFIGAVVSVVTQILALAPFHKLFVAMGTPNDETLSSYVAAALQVFALIAGTYAAVKRAKNPQAPLTLTVKSAEAHPNSIAYAANTAQNPPPIQPEKPS